MMAHVTSSLSRAIRSQPSACAARLVRRGRLGGHGALSCWGLPSSSSFSSSSTTLPSPDQGGYKSIGSFHNENLAEMLAQTDDSYVAPPLPFSEDDLSSTTTIDPNNNKNNNRDYYSLNLRDWTFLNHGAFGASLKVGQRRAQAWRQYLEEQPLRYHDRDLLPHLAHSARLLAKALLVGGGREEHQQELPESLSSYALLPNVTSGMNAVLSNYTRRYGKEGRIILWDTTYGSVKSMAQFYGRHGRITEIPLVSQYLVSSTLLTKGDTTALSVLAQALEEHATMTKEASATFSTTSAPPPLLLLDHTTSNTALTFPIADVARVARHVLHPDTLVVVDGAHGLFAQDTASAIRGNGSSTNNKDTLQTPINVYLANGHKWLSAPRGVALAWSRDAETTRQLLEYPAVLSHGMHAPDMFSQFVWDGCRDYNAGLAVPAVLDFWHQSVAGLSPSSDSRKVQQETRWTFCRRQIRERLWDGLALLAHQWHGMPWDVVKLQQEGYARGLLLAPYGEWLDTNPMVLMRLPPHLEHSQQGNINTPTDAKRIQDFLYEQNVEVPIKCIEGRLFTRVSCHIYNELSDFERLGKVLGKD